VNGSEACELLRRQPPRKRAGWKLAQEEPERVALRRDKVAPLTLNRTEQSNIEQELNE